MLCTLIDNLICPKLEVRGCCQLRRPLYIFAFDTQEPKFPSTGNKEKIIFPEYKNSGFQYPCRICKIHIIHFLSQPSCFIIKAAFLEKCKLVHENYEELTHKCMQSGSIFHAQQKVLVDISKCKDFSRLLKESLEP